MRGRSTFRISAPAISTYLTAAEYATAVLALAEGRKSQARQRTFDKSFVEAHPETKKSRSLVKVAKHTGPAGKRAAIPTPAVNSIFNHGVEDPETDAQ